MQATDTEQQNSPATLANKSKRIREITMMNTTSITLSILLKGLDEVTEAKVGLWLVVDSSSKGGYCDIVNPHTVRCTQVNFKKTGNKTPSQRETSLSYELLTKCKCSYRMRNNLILSSDMSSMPWALIWALCHKPFGNQSCNQSCNQGGNQSGN